MKWSDVQRRRMMKWYRLRATMGTVVAAVIMAMPGTTGGIIGAMLPVVALANMGEDEASAVLEQSEIEDTGATAQEADVPVAEETPGQEGTADAIGLATKLAPNGAGSYDATKLKVSGDTVTLLQAVTLPDRIGYAGVATLDLAGQVLSTNAGYINPQLETTRLTIVDSLGGGKVISSDAAKYVLLVSNSATVVVGEGVTIDGGKTAAIAVNAANLDVNGAKVSSSTEAIKPMNGSTMTMTNSTVSGGTYGVSASCDKNHTMCSNEVAISGGNIRAGSEVGVYAEGDTTVTVAGTTIVSENNYGVAVFDDVNLKMTGSNVAGLCALTTNGSGTSDKARIEISGSELTSTRNTAMYLPGMATVTVEDSKVSGVAGIVVRGGNLTVKSGTITATGDGTVDVGDSGTVVPAGAVVADDISGYNLGSVSILGGTFDGKIAYTDSREGAGLRDAEGVLVVAGGSFSDSLVGTDYLAPGLTVQLEKSSGNTPFSYYGSVDEAMAQAEPGDELTDLSAEEAEGQPVVRVTVDFGYGEPRSVVAIGEYTLPDPCDNGGCPTGWTFQGWKVSRVSSLSRAVSFEDGDILEAGASILLDADVEIVAQWDKEPTGPEGGETEGGEPEDGGNESQDVPTESKPQVPDTGMEQQFVSLETGKPSTAWAWALLTVVCLGGARVAAMARRKAERQKNLRK